MTMIGVNKSYVLISNASDPILGNEVTNNLTNPGRGEGQRYIYYLATERNQQGIFADVIVYIFSHLHRALRTEVNMLDMN